MLPAGAVLECTAHYDNSANNPDNPDPSKVVKARRPKLGRDDERASSTWLSIPSWIRENSCLRSPTVVHHLHYKRLLRSRADHKRRRSTPRKLAAGLRFLLLILAVPYAGLTHDVITTKLTWNREISRVLYKRCVSCHRDGGSGYVSVDLRRHPAVGESDPRSSSGAHDASVGRG